MSIGRTLGLSWDPGPHPPLLSVAQLGFLPWYGPGTGHSAPATFAKWFWPEPNCSRLGISVVGQQSGLAVKSRCRCQSTKRLLCLWSAGPLPPSTLSLSWHEDSTVHGGAGIWLGPGPSWLAETCLPLPCLSEVILTAPTW